MFSRPLDWIIGYKWYVVAMAASVLISGALGYRIAANDLAKQYATAQQEAISKALAAQAIKTKADREAAVADALSRRVVEEKVKIVTNTVYRNRVKLVPNPCRTKVPVQSMRTLNSIGRTK